MNLIEAAHLNKTFGEATAVEELSLQVAAGEIYGLVGPDGAGKTTTMRMLCGALRPEGTKAMRLSGARAVRSEGAHAVRSEGARAVRSEEARAVRSEEARAVRPEGAHAVRSEGAHAVRSEGAHAVRPYEPPAIRIAGFDMLRHTEQARARIGYLAQRFSLYEELTVLENIRFFAEVRGLSPAEWRPRCMQILEFVGLDGYTGRRAGFLSGGMKQKLGLAAALVHQPQVLLLDEPTTGVDPVTRQDFWQLIIRLVGENNAGGRQAAVLVSTPYMDEAARCSRVGFMRSGRLIVEGSPAELRSRLEGRVLELVGQPLPRLRSLAEADESVEDVQMFGDRLHIRCAAGRAGAVQARLQEQISAQECEVSQLRRISPQLEDVFMSLVQAPGEGPERYEP